MPVPHSDAAGLVSWPGGASGAPNPKPADKKVSGGPPLLAVSLSGEVRFALECIPTPQASLPYPRASLEKRVVREVGKATGAEEGAFVLFWWDGKLAVSLVYSQRIRRPP